MERALTGRLVQSPLRSYQVDSTLNEVTGSEGYSESTVQVDIQDALCVRIKIVHHIAITTLQGDPQPQPYIRINLLLLLPVMGVV